ncbi:MarR family winged helix-turn-helix transcriptional regulator [Aeromicrobium sp. 9AM]|uniref:MarR family winged helix-turn-helix transcriptional regulator n=1 Tax=Aeromicrobium sp. 9AM TaxID=2653126 RepID=UPI0012F15A9E|nr:MarR family winged helix-turn-helix transcriptional regulator [Aeromicrobium sp. 9AM]VXB56389.1 Regulatory protein MarR [Aeromicrobium sp. 9AM]
MPGPSAEVPVPPRPAFTAARIAEAWQRELPGSATESIEVITPLWQVAKLLADDRRSTLRGLGIDAATLDLLSTLKRSGEPYVLTTRELAARCLVTAGAISQRLTRAEEVGYVRRARSGSTGQNVSVTLTSKGNATIEPAVRQLLDHELEVISVLSDAERAQLSSILSKLVDSLT